MWGSARSGLFKGLVTALCIVSIIWIALTYFIPAPPSKVIMATAFKGASFEYYGQQYRDIFARFNVKLELRETAGGVENVALLQDPKSDVQIAFVQAGVSDGKHTPGILSLGTVYNQPYWIFYSATEPLDRLSQLKGKRIAVGPQGSGTRLAAEKILGKGGVNSETATLLPFAGLAAVNALSDKKVDAVWIIGSPDATAVKSFLGNPDVRLLGFPMAEAYTRIYPELVRLVLPKGVVDIDQTIPADDVQLIGTTTKVLVRSDLNPEIVELLLQTMTETHSRQEIFQRSGEFPNATDAEYPVAATAIDYYKNGPSYLRRHVPLWLSVHVQRAIAVLVAGVAIGLPLFHYLPLLYKWKMRRRLLHWYSQLKALEASFDASPSDKHLLEKQIEIERIEDAVKPHPFPANLHGPAL
jgi:TRAP transporter TAXI family solute receptor